MAGTELIIVKKGEKKKTLLRQSYTISCLSNVFHDLSYVLSIIYSFLVVLLSSFIMPIFFGKKKN